VGVISIFLNKALDYFWIGVSALFDKAQKVAAAGSGTTYTRGGAVVDYKGCYVQGFEIDALKSSISSQTLVVTATILSYYIMDLVLNRGWGSALASIIVGGALFFAQASSMSAGGCFANSGMTVAILTSAANGILFGGIAYGVVQAYFPSRLPSGVIQSRPPNINDLTLDQYGRLCDDLGICYVTTADGELREDTCKDKTAPATNGQCVADSVSGATAGSTTAAAAGATGPATTTK
jgi:hypothetical protein